MVSTKAQLLWLETTTTTHKNRCILKPNWALVETNIKTQTSLTYINMSCVKQTPVFVQNSNQILKLNIPNLYECVMHKTNTCICPKGNQILNPSIPFIHECIIHKTNIGIFPNL